MPKQKDKPKNSGRGTKRKKTTSKRNRPKKRQKTEAKASEPRESAEACSSADSNPSISNSPSSALPPTENADMRAERRREEATAPLVVGDLPPLPEEEPNASGMDWESDSVTTMDTDISLSVATTVASKEEKPQDGTPGVEAQEEEPEEQPTLSEYREVRGAPPNFEVDPAEADDVNDYRQAVLVYYYDGQDVYYWQDGQWKRSTHGHGWFVKWPLASIEQVEATGPVPTSTHVDTDETYENMWDRVGTEDDLPGLGRIDEEADADEREEQASDMRPPSPKRRRYRKQRPSSVAREAAALDSKGRLRCKEAAKDVAEAKEHANASSLHMHAADEESAAWRESISRTDDKSEDEYNDWLQETGGSEEEQTHRKLHRLAMKTDVQRVLEYGRLLEKEKKGETLCKKDKQQLARMKAMREGNFEDDVQYAREVMDKALRAWRKRAEVTWKYFMGYVADIGGGYANCFDKQGPTVKAIKAFLVYARKRHPDARYTVKGKKGLKMSTVNGWKNHISSCIKDRMEGAANHKKHPQWRNRALARSISRWIKAEWLEGLKQGTDTPKQAIALSEEQLALLSENMETVLGRVIGIKTRAILLVMLHCLYRYQDISKIQWEGLDSGTHPNGQELWRLLVEEPTKADEESKIRWITDSYASYWTCATTHLARWLEVSPTQLGHMFPREGNQWEAIPYPTLLARIRRVAKATPGLEDFVDQMTLHMPRRSGAQIYLTRGGTLEHLMIAGGWRSMAVKRYIKGAMSGGLFSVSCVLSGCEPVSKNRRDYAHHSAKMTRMRKEISMEQGRANKAESLIEKNNRAHAKAMDAATTMNNELLAQLRALRLENSALRRNKS